jgi:hypothetical protein
MLVEKTVNGNIYVHTEKQSGTPGARDVRYIDVNTCNFNGDPDSLSFSYIFFIPLILKLN